MAKYEIRFLKPAEDFLEVLDQGSREKILFNIWKSRTINDPSIFKKLTGEIWEFRARSRGKQIRLLAFWDKTKEKPILVILTHGFVKRTNKVPRRELARAKKLRKQYFEHK